MKKNNMYYISGLGAIRGISACLIVYFHVWAICGFAGISAIIDGGIGNLDSLVRMFFMLSGFALLCGYEKTIFANEKSIINFYIKRFFKIAPIFYVALILQILIGYFLNGEKYSITSIILSISLMFGLLPTNQELIVWASWAVGIEWIFYLLFPMFVVVVKNKWALVIATISSFIITYNYKGIIGDAISNSHINVLIYLSYFFIGAVLYQCIPRIKAIRKYNSWRFIQVIYIACSISLGVLLARQFERNIGMLVAFSLIIAGSIYGYTSVIDNKFTDWLGKISYSIYLLHMIVIQIFSKFGVIQRINGITKNEYVNYFMTSTIILIVTCLIAHFTTKYVEEYWVNKGKKYVL